MKKFQIEIEEILQRVEEVEANNIDEALEKIYEKYNKEEIVLDYEDFKDCEIREYRDGVKEEDLVKDNIIEINIGKAIILEKEKDWALIKKLGVATTPYIVTNGLRVHKSKTYFEWLQGSYHNNLAEASKMFEKMSGINKNMNDIIFSELGKTTLENYCISKFENINEIFEFLIDEDMNRETLINMLSEEMKEELILSYTDSVREENGSFYYGEDICFFEHDINEKVEKINKILSAINIDIEPYTIIELLEKADKKEIDKELENKVGIILDAAGYKQTTSKFIKYINEELEKENIQKDEEDEILE